MTNEQLELALADVISLTAKGLTNSAASIHDLIEVSKLILKRLEALERKVNQ